MFKDIILNYKILYFNLKDIFIKRIIFYIFLIIGLNNLYILIKNYMIVICMEYFKVCMYREVS